MLSTDQVRKTFLDYFVSQGHLRIPGDSLVPPPGSTVMFTVAGVQQMIPFFLGRQQPPAPRLATVQKCFRTVDIDDVGNTRTLTFFEMLGNFSVGDYFKERAIPFAHELLLQGFGFDIEDLWFTVHPTDSEAVEHWLKVGVRREHIVALEDNWWPPGEGALGPCGPDSEIFFDRGSAFGCGLPTCGPGCDCGRFLEIWNLVFMQYNREQSGDLIALPRPNVDTGMGLERMAVVLQGAATIYEIDSFQDILKTIGNVARVSYGTSDRGDRSMRIIADHCRSATFLIADGVIPSNTGRGYVLRRIVRRAVRNAKLLGVEEPFVSGIANKVIEQLGHTYPELQARRDRIVAVLGDEEQRFSATLASGLHELDRLIREARAHSETSLRGSDLFRLYDSHGLPFEVAQEVATEEGLTLDRAGFDALLEEQRLRGQRLAHAEKGTVEGDRLSMTFQDVGATRFAGYDTTTMPDSFVERLTVDGNVVDEASEGQTVALALDATPFYARGGGQVPDTGTIQGPTGSVEVTDVRQTTGAVVMHLGRVTAGTLRAGDEVTATVDATRRANIMRNHTATHLLHAALRAVLGDQVTQAGSVVAPDRLLFDFTYGGSPNHEQLRQIERIVNTKIQADIVVSTAEMPIAQARAEGAMALFGEKYGETVRVVSIDGFSKELCGGTHVFRTGGIGAMFVTSESSVGAGHRRVEAVTGPAAIDLAWCQRETLNQLMHTLQAPAEQLVQKTETLLNEQREGKRRLEQAERAAAKDVVAAIASGAETFGTVTFAGAVINVNGDGRLREISDALRDRFKQAIIVLGTPVGDRGVIVVAITPDLVASGWNAGHLAKEVGAAVGGSGGGRPHLAQAGVKEPAQLDAWLTQARTYVRQRAAP